MLSKAISPPRLRRVLLRPRLPLESDVERVAQKLVELAKDRCDQRIYVDDTFVPVLEKDSWLWEELDKQDAIDGDSVWFRGRQAWFPQRRSLD
ncbi:hypothetical protein EXIGLDRAFT_735437 [Exidia glandulosa HHB12029]|uniref:Uncharacterized protein n=1 Tax=Exidia glandulosa HHB12029 TaxID=1314781 RepID=A0A166NJG8_EXIGL|nr:hypothetical protein EXIGLDRAFT_735437 [Exidia glandulosa HHB12029]